MRETKPKPRTARQASRAAAALYPGLPGDAPLPPLIYGPLRPNHVWDMTGQEVPLMRGRRWVRPAEKEEDEHDNT